MTAGAGKDFLLQIGDGGVGVVAAVKASAIIGDLTFQADTAGAEGNEFSVRFITGGTAGAETVHELDGAITIKIQSGVSTATQIKTAFDASDQAAELDCSISGTDSNAQVIGSAHQLSGGADATSAEAYTTIGGLRSAQITINAGAIEKTNSGSSQWKELLDGAGIKSMAVSGSGVFTDSASEAQAQTDCLAQTLRNFKIIDSNTGDYFLGTFKITSLEYQGEYDKTKNWSMKLESSGAIAFTAA